MLNNIKSEIEAETNISKKDIIQGMESRVAAETSMGSIKTSLFTGMITLKELLTIILSVEMR